MFLAIVFGFGWSMLAWDLSMSMDFHFQSTMYGWQVFMGGWLVALMTWAVLLRWWKRQFPELPELVTEKHYHDVGKLSFAFTAFWGYLTFSQFLVIWYGNLAEETHFFTLRLTGAWTTTTMLAAVLTFVLPFFGLLSVKAKTRADDDLLRRLLVRGALVLALHRDLPVALRHAGGPCAARSDIMNYNGGFAIVRNPNYWPHIVMKLRK